MPPQSGQLVLHLHVPFPVTVHLLEPELGVRFRHGVISAPLVHVPEAAVHKDARAILPQHDVRFSRQPRMVQPIAEPPAPQKPPHNHLRPRVLPTNSRHTPVPLFRSKMVGHHYSSLNLAFFISSLSLIGSGKATREPMLLVNSFINHLYCVHSGSVSWRSRR